MRITIQSIIDILKSELNYAGATNIKQRCIKTLIDGWYDGIELDFKDENNDRFIITVCKKIEDK